MRHLRLVEFWIGNFEFLYSNIPAGLKQFQRSEYPNREIQNFQSNIQNKKKPRLPAGFLVGEW
jgi:hypothetical protein